MSFLTKNIFKLLTGALFFNMKKQDLVNKKLEPLIKKAQRIQLVVQILAVLFVILIISGIALILLLILEHI